MNKALELADVYREQAKQGKQSLDIWSVITMLEREVSPLLAESPEASASEVPDDVRKDAERYRWLANDCDGNAQDDFTQMLARTVLSRKEFDEEIDAAMQSASPCEKGVKND